MATRKNFNWRSFSKYLKGAKARVPRELIVLNKAMTDGFIYARLDAIAKEGEDGELYVEDVRETFKTFKQARASVTVRVKRIFELEEKGYIERVGKWGCKLLKEKRHDLVEIKDIDVAVNTTHTEYMNDKIYRILAARAMGIRNLKIRPNADNDFVALFGQGSYVDYSYVRKVEETGIITKHIEGEWWVYRITPAKAREINIEQNERTYTVSDEERKNMSANRDLIYY